MQSHDEHCRESQKQTRGDAARAEPFAPRAGHGSLGPFVNVAVLCRGIVPQPNGSIDVVGVARHDLVMDRYPQDARTPRQLPTTVVVGLHGGDIRGTYTLTVQVRYPSGAAGPRISRLAEFSDEKPALTLHFPTKIVWTETGDYAVDVLLDHVRLTEIRLRVSPSASAASPPSEK